jgi:hypothetical protein
MVEILFLSINKMILRIIPRPIQSRNLTESEYGIANSRCESSSVVVTAESSTGRPGTEVIIEDLLIEVLPIVIQQPLNPLSPVAKDEFQFRSPHFTQKGLNASEKSLWLGKLLYCQCRLHVPENPEARRC